MGFVRACKVLQYGSTLVGLPGLIVLASRWCQRQPAEPVADLGRLNRSSRAVALVGISAVGLGAGIWAAQASGMTPYQQLGRGITAGGLALGLAVLAYVLWFNASRRQVGRD